MSYSTMNYYYFDGQVISANTKNQAAEKFNYEDTRRFAGEKPKATVDEVEEITYQEYQEIRSNRNVLNANKIFNFNFF